MAKRRRDLAGPAWPDLKPWGTLCRLRGRYGPPGPFTDREALWRDDLKAFRATAGCGVRCEHEGHRERRRYFPLDEMRAQRWVLTDEERREAEYEYDILSLEGLPPRLVCPACADRQSGAERTIEGADEDEKE
jgi:hypothetical protein